MTAEYSVFLIRLHDQGDHVAPPACTRRTGKLLAGRSDRRLAARLGQPAGAEGFDASGEHKTAAWLTSRSAASPHDPTCRLLLRRVERRQWGIPGEDRNQPRTSFSAITPREGPLISDPGTRWEYGITSISSASGEARERQALDAYLRDHLFTPLGMNDIDFKNHVTPTHGWSGHVLLAEELIAGSDPDSTRAESGIS